MFIISKLQAQNTGKASFKLVLRPLIPWIAQIVFVAVLSLFCVGCKGLNRLTNGDDTKAPFVPAVGGATEIGPTPNFTVPTPAGFSRMVFHDLMPANGIVSVTSNVNANVVVFLKDFSGNWFMLQDKQIPAYWYSYDAATGMVQYKCKDLSWMKEFCVYEYLPN